MAYLFIFPRLLYPIFCADFLLITNSPGVSIAGTVSVPIGLNTLPPAAFLCGALKSIISNSLAPITLAILLTSFPSPVVAVLICLLASAYLRAATPASLPNNFFKRPLAALLKGLGKSKLAPPPAIVALVRAPITPSNKNPSTASEAPLYKLEKLNK